MPSYSDKEIAYALQACRGMVYVASRYLSCSPNTIKARIKKSQWLQEILETQRELLIEHGESKLLQPGIPCQESPHALLIKLV